MKRSLCLLLVIAVCASMFIGCGGTQDTNKPAAPTTAVTTAPAGTTAPAPTKAPGKVEVVNYFSSVGAYKTKVEERVAKFNDTIGKEKGIKINLTSEIDNSTTVLETAIKAGNSPDLFSVNADTYIAYAKNNWIRDLKEIPEIKATVDKYAKYDVPMVTSYKGKVYSLPLEILPIKLAYNKDLFKAAGIVDAKGEAVPPKTWAEVLTDAKKITDAGKGQYYGLGFSFQWIAGIRRTIFKSYVAALGHGWFDNVKGQYDFEAMRPALEFIQQMGKDKSYFPGIETIGIDPIRAQFSDGKVGMEFAPAYDIAVYNDQFPHKGNWGIAEIPTLDGTQKFKGAAILRGNLHISSTVKQDRMWAVAEVFNYMHADEFYMDLYQNCSIIPLNTEIISKATNVKSKVGWKEMSQIDNYIAMPPFPDAQLTLGGDTYHNVFVDMFFGKISINDAIAKCNKVYNDALKQAVSDGKVDLNDYKIPADYFNIKK